MNYQELIEIRKKIDLNLTEPEVLMGLVNQAKDKGEKAQREIERLQRVAYELLDFFLKSRLLYSSEQLKDVSPKYNTVVGIDGSFQLVGGAGGLWYAPISVARIIFESGDMVAPKVNVDAVIEEIMEQDDPNPNIKAEMMMLSAETKAILNWGSQRRESYVFIDGPIVDPPVKQWGGSEYIRDRCDAIARCLEKSTVIGVVKRSRDRFYLTNLKSYLTEADQRKVESFPSDQHLMAFVFSRYRSLGARGSIFTKWIKLSGSKIAPIYEEYEKCGVQVVTFFFQKDTMSQILRIDVALNNDAMKDERLIDEETYHIAKALDIWTYPGQDYPLPVFLAHEKCNIREGTAEVLYEEIITRGRTMDPSSSMVWNLLR